MNHPILYKKTSTGKIQQWTISVFENVIRTEYGQVGGKLQVATDEVEYGKNIGRSNETTPHEQAKTEAKSAWEKKLKRTMCSHRGRPEVEAPVTSSRAAFSRCSRTGTTSTRIR